MPREQPRGTVTILFTDIVGHTEMMRRLGDAKGRDVLRAHERITRDELTRHGGVEVKTDGDSFMASFGSASAGVECAIAMQRAFARYREAAGEPIAVRMGLNVGEPIEEDGDFFGTAVILGARIQAEARGGEILVPEAVRHLLSGKSFRFIDRGEFVAKGFNDAVRLYEVLWRAEPSAIPLSPAEGLPFVGREAESARVRQALERAASGEGALLLIAGEAGVGKTRLAEECAAKARPRGFLTLTGRCYESSGGPPYGPFAEIVQAATRAMPPLTLETALAGDAPAIAQLFPEFRRSSPGGDASPPPRGLTKQSLFAAFREFLARAASAQPLLLVVDDLQWADAATLQLLRFLARRVHEMRALVVATYRDNSVEIPSAFAQALDEWHSKRLAAEIELAPFGVAGVETMLQAASGRPPPHGVARALHAETNGNAFFIEELYRHLAEEGELFDEDGDWRPVHRINAESLPKKLRLVIKGRLGHLATSTRQLLDAAAVIGTTFDVELLENVAALRGGELLDCLDEAERAGIVIPDTEGGDTRFRFGHPLMRSAIISDLTSSQRQRLHARAAAAIEACADRAPALDSQLAHHYRAAGRLADPERAIAALRRAGVAALDAHANVEAAADLKEALKFADRLAHFRQGDLADIVHHLGQAQYRLGAWEDSRASLDRALSLYRDAGDSHGQAQVLYSKSSLATFDSRPADALQFLTQAGDLTPDDESLRGLVAGLESQNLVDLRQYGDAARARDEALAIAERLDDPYILDRACFASGYFALATLDMKPAVDDFARVSERNAAALHERMAAESRGAIALACVGDLEAGENRGNRARGYFRSMRDVDDAFDDPAAERDPFEFGVSCVASGIAAIARGQFEELHESLTEAIQKCGTPPNPWVVRTLTPMMLQVLHYLGRYGEAEAWLDTLVPAAGGRRPTFRRLFNSLQAGARGDLNAVENDLPPPPPHRPDLQSLPVTTLATETAVALRDADAVRLQLDALEHLRERGMLFTVGWVALIPRLLGAAYTLAGEEVRAATMLETALEVAQSSGARTELALTHLELAELHAARGATAAARADLADARSLFAALAMRSCDARAAALASGLKLVERRGARSLTERETAILRLIAAGLSNRDIAQEQSMTVAALQRQLGTLYGKIDVGSRAAAIAYAYRTGIVRDGG